MDNIVMTRLVSFFFFFQSLGEILYFRRKIKIRPKLEKGISPEFDRCPIQMCYKYLITQNPAQRSRSSSELRISFYKKTTATNFKGWPVVSTYLLVLGR